MTHAAWDELAIADLFFFLPSQKTIKTRCNRRVAFKHVSKDGVNCPECLVDRQRQEAGHAAVLQYCKEHGIEV